MAIMQVNQWSLTPASGVIDALPDDWDEAVEQVAHRNGMGDMDFGITPRILERAYARLYAEFTDAAARKELQCMTVAEVVEWYLDL